MYYLHSSISSDTPLASWVQTEKAQSRLQSTKFRHTCGVITTILEVNEAVVHFAEKIDATLIVVGDLKTNHSEWNQFQNKYKHSVVYLSPETQKSMRFKILKYVPWNHFGRKSIGFIYAVSQGCKAIFDFDDDNHLTFNSFGDMRSWKLGEVKPIKPISQAIHVYNPYMHFLPTNSSFIWPRGFPLQFIQDKRTYGDNSSDFMFRAINESFESMAIIQSLADHDPDVDAIYRMTRPLPVSFDAQNEILLLDRGVYTPWNAQAVLVTEAAFFGLLLPVTVTGRVSDIWRSYITTRLLWETKYRLGFTSSFVTQYRNPHSYMKDFVDESDLYNKVDKLLEVLATWTSHGHVKLDSAYIDIITRLARCGILASGDVTLAKAWVADLQRLGYVWPAFNHRFSEQTISSASIVDQRHLG